jgi:hypothetical protein
VAECSSTGVAVTVVGARTSIVEQRAISTAEIAPPLWPFGSSFTTFGDA